MNKLLNKEGADYVFGDDKASVNLSKIILQTDDGRLQKKVGRFLANFYLFVKGIEFSDSVRLGVYKMLRDKAFSQIEDSRVIHVYPKVVSHLKTAVVTHLKKAILRKT